MRDKFSELINAGVASFTYKPIVGNIPEQDPIARLYNNIFSIASDTHMSCINGERVITGHMINTPKWDTFTVSPYWANVDFRTSGYWSVSDFLNKNGYRLEKSIQNGDTVAKVVEIPAEPEDQAMSTPVSFTTSESQIPQPICLLTADNNALRIKECVNNSKNMYELAKNMNENVYIKGEDWLVCENKIVGMVNGKSCVMNIL